MSMNSVQLYRHLLRKIKKLPEDAQAYYKHHVRQSYSSHVDEKDPERIKEIIQRTLEDSEWVMKKYNKAS